MNETNLETYKINQVSKILGVGASTLRDYEKALENIIVVPRDTNGYRFYTKREIELFKKAISLKEELGLGSMKDVAKFFNNAKDFMGLANVPATSSEVAAALKLPIPPSNPPAMTEGSDVIREGFHQLKTELAVQFQSDFQGMAQKLTEDITEKVTANLTSEFSNQMKEKDETNKELILQNERLSLENQELRKQKTLLKEKNKGIFTKLFGK
ncbi:MerR family transcriptional regulator [Bacillus cereus group sp. BfR-BA-01491]|uniref:MerR family transcriptional regulator n=1 Tax=Bacillus cereus group sp. BfR-BA-01491 TaxID=2920360 RepID=UPI001F57457A|nr:MerR family transcriptional regulator [Bacillus cereus group sp. BfR-BA-01491]